MLKIPRKKNGEKRKKEGKMRLETKLKKKIRVGWQQKVKRISRRKRNKKKRREKAENKE